MPTSPTRAMRHYSSTLQDSTVAFQQDDAAFVAGNAATWNDTEKKEAGYYIYDTGEWNRMQMCVRGTSEKSARGGWTHSRDTYHCNRHSIEHAEDWADVADADEAFNIDEDNAEWLANQGKMHADYSWQAVVMLPATWTTDYDGVAASPSTSEQLQWNDSSADPQKNTEVLKSAVHSLIGRFPNVMVVGADVHAQVITNTVVRDAIKHTDKTFIDGASLSNTQLASFFGVERYLVARGIYNTAAKGATVSMGYLVNKKDLWLGYISPTKGKKKLTAVSVFAWRGPDGVGSNGLVTYKYDDDDIRSTVYGIEEYIDVKIISADAGAFVDDCVA